MRSIFFSALIFNEVVASGVPGVKGMWCPPAGGGRYLQIISIKQMYGRHATHAGHAVASSRSGGFSGRYTIIVNEDVKPHEWMEEFEPVNIASEQMGSQAFNKWKDMFKGRLQLIKNCFRIS